MNKLGLAENRLATPSFSRSGQYSFNVGNSCVMPDINQHRLKNAALVSRLAIERSLYKIAHIHALMHLCTPPDNGLDNAAAESTRLILAAIHEDLLHGAHILEFSE